MSTVVEALKKLNPSIIGKRQKKSDGHIFPVVVSDLKLRLNIIYYKNQESFKSPNHKFPSPFSS